MRPLVAAGAWLPPARAKNLRFSTSRQAARLRHGRRIFCTVELPTSWRPVRPGGNRDGYPPLSHDVTIRQGSDICMRYFGRQATAAVLTLLLGFAADAAAGTVVTVDSTGDGSDISPGNGVCVSSDGSCTLRAALEEANATPGLDTIAFAIGSGVQRITVASGLPTVTSPVVIDGWTQPGFAGTPLIELRGGSGDGLRISAGGSTVRGLAINGFSGNGVVLTGGGGNVLEGNYVGLDVSGANAVSNSGSGLLISGSSNNRIGGTSVQQRNVISANLPKGNGGGIVLDTSSGNVIQGNYIGTDATGMEDRGNDGRGIAMRSASKNVIGGPEPGAGNLISGNWATAIRVLGGSNGSLIQGNIIGLNRTLTAALPNDRGVQIRGSHDTQVVGNVIGGQVYDGILIWESSNNNRVYSNTIVYNGYGNRDPSEEAFNGVYVYEGVGNYVNANRIHGNRDLGIRLGPPSLAPAPAPPTIISATVSGSVTTIAGHVAGSVGTEFVVDLFVNSACEYDGAGEGQYVIGQFRVTAGANGLASFNVAVGWGAPVGWLITATATRAAQNTSQFAACKAVQ